MEALQQYLNNEYLLEKEQFKSVEDLIEKVVPFYSCFLKDYGWPYQIGQTNELSTSTTSMIAFSLLVLMGGRFDLGVDLECKNYIKLFFKSDSEKYLNILEKSKELIIKDYVKNEYNFISGTYGVNDPFTFMWVKNLIDQNKDNQLINAIDNNFLKIFNEKCENKIKNVFKTLYKDKNDLAFSTIKGLEKEGPIAKTHVFPLLKIIQLYNSVERRKKEAGKEQDNSTPLVEDIYVNAVREILNNSMHYHLSLASIENSNFDAAELVFSLEGLLLLDFNRENFDQNLLDRVFQVIKERQKISQYWRPLKPFVLNQQGLALLPLSVEIAMSLIRICRLLGKKGERLFSNNYIIFEKYTDWLKTRVTNVTCDKSMQDLCEIKEWCINKDDCFHHSFFGWCSEHIFQPNIIHPWETSQVLVYLANFNDMLQKHIGYKALKYANFAYEAFKKDNSIWNDIWVEKNEPVSVNGYKVFRSISENYISETKKNSMLLFGPPGTGKSTIAKNIAKAKGWPLITITPSDFIADGTDQVETKAKGIFTVLEEQSAAVVLFDEIDRLILDRDSESYHDQEDMFQFMTPSMLVKLNNLRSKGKVIFIISTNYAERIDRAIKRAGRIDEQYLVLPPDKERRKKIIIERIQEEKIHDIIKEGSPIIEDIANRTALYTYTELKQLIEKIAVLIGNLDDKENININNFECLINYPSITLLSYANSIGIVNDEKNDKINRSTLQKPIKDFLSLIYLKAEVRSSFDKNELKVIENYISTNLTTEENLDIINTELKSEQMIDIIIQALAECPNDKIKSAINDYFNERAK